MVRPITFALVGAALGADASGCPTYQHTVSGVSSGGSMAMIHAISRSSCVKGVGVVAGSAYGCNAILSKCSQACAAGTCECQAQNIGLQEAYLQKRVTNDQIDDLANVKGMPAWLFSGSSDDVVYQCVMKSVQTQFSSLGANVSAVYNIPSAHGWVVDGNNFPGKASFPRCGNPGTYYIEDCTYDMSLLMFQHIYPAASQPMRSPFSTTLYSNLVSINQAKYVPQQHSAASIGMASTALAYVPTSCAKQAQSCAIHVNYHGCGGGGTTTSSASYLFWVEIPYIAETNNIIVLYPQAVAASYFRSVNPNGCWDWEGYYGDANFDSRDGAQMSTVLAMVADIYNVVAAEEFLARPLQGLTTDEVQALAKIRAGSDIDASMISV